jgi:hypothetical protein
MSIITILVGLLIFAVVYWAAVKIMAAFGIGEPISTVIIVVLVIVFLVWVLGALGVGPTLIK